MYVLVIFRRDTEHLIHTSQNVEPSQGNKGLNVNGNGEAAEAGTGDSESSIDASILTLNLAAREMEVITLICLHPLSEVNWSDTDSMNN